MKLLEDKTLDKYADEFYFEGGEPKISDFKPCNSFEEDWAVCWSDGTPKGQCGNCGFGADEHDKTAFPPKTAKPNSFWVAWYECRPTVIQFDNTGEYFYALGQDALWYKQHAELIEEIKVFAIAGQHGNPIH